MFEKLFRFEYKMFILLSIILFIQSNVKADNSESLVKNDLNSNSTGSFSNNTLIKAKRQLSACYSNPCNYGTCYDVALAQLSATGFYCVCSTGYTGTQCEKEINECASNPCKNGAQCLDLVGSFFCSCQNGYAGVLCENLTSRKICPDNACGDGECVLTTHPTHQYACKCKDNSYKFEPCSSTNSVNKCAYQPCGTNLCIEAPNSPSGYVCQCGPNDFRTTSCQNALEGCIVDSCLNGGTCVAYSAGERWCNPIQAGRTCCQCPTGYTGFRCETEINECVSNPCKNGGLCDNLVNSYKCNCPLGFTGTNCEQVQGCKINPCKFGATCSVSSDGSEVCHCKEGFTGSYCEIDINECSSSPCQNGGTCIDLENSYACYCPDGYFRPTFCPTQVNNAPTTKSKTQNQNLLASSDFCPNQDVCQNGGVCRIIGSTFYCVCPEGYYGSLCELTNPPIAIVGASVLKTCTPNPCLNHGTCVAYNTGEFYTCICQVGYTGTYCENGPTQISTLRPTSECNPNPCFNDGVCLLTNDGRFGGCFCKSPQFYGQYCQNFNNNPTTTKSPTSECQPNPCFNGGKCVLSSTGKFSGCYCTSTAFSGVYCENYNPNNLQTTTKAPSSECTPNPCFNGAKCILSSTGKFSSCACLSPAFSGVYCENYNPNYSLTQKPGSECEPNPCFNGGICLLSSTGKFSSCYCKSPSYTGVYCEVYNPNQIATQKPSSGCEPNPCFNGGICFLTNSGTFGACLCQPSYSGEYCQNYNSNPSSTNPIAPTVNCFPNPCFNGGICTSKGCICASGYSGQYCETLITGTLCNYIKCQNGGICNVVLRGSVPTAECWCLKNYSGFYCEIPTVAGANRCNQIQCLNNGTCSETLSGVTTSAYCTCKPGFTGPRCETEYFRCAKDGIFTDIYGCANGRYLECVYYGQSSVGLSNGILFRRDCPPGLRFNAQFGYCDYAINVECPPVK